MHGGPVFPGTAISIVVTPFPANRKIMRVRQRRRKMNKVNTAPVSFPGDVEGDSNCLNICRNKAFDFGSLMAFPVIWTFSRVRFLSFLFIYAILRGGPSVRLSPGPDNGESEQFPIEILLPDPTKNYSCDMLTKRNRCRKSYNFILHNSNLFRIPEI